MLYLDSTFSKLYVALQRQKINVNILLEFHSLTMFLTAQQTFLD